MRGGRGCRICRQQHTKCVVQNGSDSCQRCLEAGRTCDFDPKFRFKQVVRIESSQAARPGVDLVHKKDQVWVDTERFPLNYVFEDGINLDQDYSGVAQEQQLHRFPVDERPGNSPNVSGANDAESLPPDLTRGQQYVDISDGLPGAQRTASMDHSALVIDGPPDPFLPLNLPPLQRNNSLKWTPTGASPSSTLSLVTPPPNEYPMLASTYVARPLSQNETPHIKLSRREAGLIHYYIAVMTPWADTSDPDKHFAREVPHRALRKPMMLYAIFALCSRHQAIMSDGTDEIESSAYHDRCVGLLIEALSAPEDTYDEDLLVTVVILRHYEELKTTDDNLYHLFGSSQLLNAISRFSSSGGLGEAASWWCLRQAIYVSLVQHQPLDIRLENFDHSAAFGMQTDHSATNVVVLIFAKMLRLLYSTESVVADQWSILEQDLDRWNLLKPVSYRPIYYQEPDFAKDRPFPEICMMNTPQVVGMQYYHACKIFLIQHTATTQPVLGFHATKDRRKAEKDISIHLSAIIGLAVNNDFASNACFEAHHLLYACGFCLHHPMQRVHALRFLEKAEATTGWRMSHTAVLLKEQWRDLDAPG